MASTVHKLKSWPQFFEPILQGMRSHELRRNDRCYKVGDLIELREYDNTSGQYTGRTCLVVVTAITSMDEPCAVSSEGLNPNFCILSIHRMSHDADACFICAAAHQDGISIDPRVS